MLNFTERKNSTKTARKEEIQGPNKKWGYSSTDEEDDNYDESDDCGDDDHLVDVSRKGRKGWKKVRSKPHPLYSQRLEY